MIFMTEINQIYDLKIVVITKKIIKNIAQWQSRS